MGDDHPADESVDHPTYMADIRFFFRTVDVEHMAKKGIDLGTYDGVKRNRFAIYAQVSPPNPNMPILDDGKPDVANQWSAARLQTFNNWMTDGSPLGTATPATSEAPTTGGVAAGRVRKNIAGLGDDEIATLQKAFLGLMGRPDPTESTPPPEQQSYAHLAGLHGLPGAYCMHHIDGFNPWHRVYLKVFEDALRTVPGCEDVTLPYWDILTPLPDVLKQAPFASYTLGTSPGPLTTSRYAPDQITQNLNTSGGPGGVPAQIATSLRQTMWGKAGSDGYQLYSIQAHDNGHGSIGRTMGDQDIAAYDPIFWFYHCNLDRLWLSWQTKARATDFTGFKSTLTEEALRFFTSPLNALPPWDDGSPIVTSDETIAFGIAYDKLDLGEEDVLENKVGSIEAGRAFSIKSSSPVSVAVKDIDRLSIPGSFMVNLLADGEPIAQQYFFQPSDPSKCENCKKNGLATVQFHVDRTELVDKKLSVTISVPSHEGIGAAFPLSQVGNPTINARLLLDDG